MKVIELHQSLSSKINTNLKSPSMGPQLFNSSWSKCVTGSHHHTDLVLQKPISNLQR